MATDVRKALLCWKSIKSLSNLVECSKRRKRLFFTEGALTVYKVARMFLVTVCYLLAKSCSYKARVQSYYDVA